MRRAALLLSALCLLTTDALARKALEMQSAKPPAPGRGASWSPARATGAPNAARGVDDPNAWATLAANAGPEWLAVRFDRPVRVREVRVHQNFNPGAVSKIEAITDEGPVVLWEGTDTARKPVFAIEAPAGVKAAKLRIHLDTRRVEGWNEIDAVAMVGDDMTLQWADTAEASSSYAFAGVGPLAGLVGKRVRVVHLKGTVVARFVSDSGPLLELLQDDGRPLFVAKSALVTVEPE